MRSIHHLQALITSHQLLQVLTMFLLITQGLISSYKVVAMVITIIIMEEHMFIPIIIIQLEELLDQLLEV